MRALIIDQGLDRGSLVAARALRRDGWTVGVGAPFQGLAASSRSVARWHRVPAAEDGVDGLIAAVRTAVDSHGYEVVFSADDAGVLALSMRRDEVGAIVPYGPHRSVERAQDKLELTRAAEAVGLHVPRTAEADDATLADLDGPVVVKARLHSTLDDGVPGRQNALVTTDAAAARRRAQEIRAAGGEPIAQEVVEGRLAAFVAVADRDSRVVAQVQQEAVLTWPPEVGVTARGRTVPVDPELAAKVADLLSELGWFGLAELQFLVDHTGIPRLIDLNGRWYGSLALAVAAGPNLPAIWARLATGRPVTPADPAQVGVSYQWLNRDLRASLAAHRRGRLAALTGVASRIPGSAHSVWSARDPWPALRYFGPRLLGKEPGA